MHDTPTLSGRDLACQASWPLAAWLTAFRMLEGAIRRHLLKEGVPEAMITQEDQEWDGHIYCPLRV